MFCGECGTQNPDTNQFCKNCGRPLKRPQQAPAPQPAAAPATAPQPVYYQPAPAAVPGAPGAPVAPAAAKPPLNKGLLVLGILGIVLGCVSFFFYPYLCGIAAVVLGGITLFRTERKTGITGIIAIAALVIGLASIILDHFYLVIFPPSLGFEVLCWLVT